MKVNNVIHTHIQGDSKSCAQTEGTYSNNFRIGTHGLGSNPDSGNT